jgi:putative endonuclease
VDFSLLKLRENLVIFKGSVKRGFSYFIVFMILPYCVYVLISEVDYLLYIGFTSNLENRLKTHNSGGSKSTSYRRPLKLIFYEYYLFEEDALKREQYFKTTAGKKALNLMLKSTLTKLEYKKTKKEAKIIAFTEI